MQIQTIKNIIISQSYTKFWNICFWLLLFIILILTLMPSSPKPISINQIDKLYHFIAFMVFAFVYRLAFKQTKIFLIFMFSIALGAFIEIVQYYLPNRSFSFADLIADILGAFVGLLIAQFAINKFSNSK